jgi:hypothetical protein
VAAPCCHDPNGGSHVKICEEANGCTVGNACCCCKARGDTALADEALFVGASRLTGAGSTPAQRSPSRASASRPSGNDPSRETFGQPAADTIFICGLRAAPGRALLSFFLAFRRPGTCRPQAVKTKPFGRNRQRHRFDSGRAMSLTMRFHRRRSLLAAGYDHHLRATITRARYCASSGVDLHVTNVSSVCFTLLHHNV